MEKECKSCKFFNKLAEYLADCKDSTNREYWILTEVFVFLHDGKDYCDKSNKSIKEEK